jgi:hypothetical protein
LVKAQLLTAPPTRAGHALISFNPLLPQGVLASRSGSRITVHRDFDEVVIFSLQGGQQLVIHEPGSSRAYGDVFCGTDEAPFATGIESGHFDNLVRRGEGAFYEGLMPDNIRLLRDLLGPDVVWRQGDVWGAQISPSRHSFDRRHRRDQSPGWTPVSRQRILRTRHQLTGHVTNPNLATTVNGVEIRSRLATGLLRAADHAPRAFGVSVLGRTPGLLPGVWSHGVRQLGD